MLTAVYYGGMLNIARLYALGVITRLNGWKRYDRDTYLEADIGDLPPGEVMQLVWNGMPVFVRRLTQEEIKNEKHYKELIAQSKPGQILTIKGYSQGQPFEKQIQTVERLPEIR